MLELILPYLIATAIGIEPGESGIAQAPPVATAEPDAEITRLIEPQVPTGKFTTAVEVRPILDMTRANWIAVRSYEGQDLLYFTHLSSWRCGLWEIRYGINGAPATEVFALEPCYEDSASPNAMTDVANFLPFVTLPDGSVETVTVEIDYDDGTTDIAQFDRAQVEIP